jgi:hypothetical protein
MAGKVLCGTVCMPQSQPLHVRAAECVRPQQRATCMPFMRHLGCVSAIAANAQTMHSNACTWGHCSCHLHVANTQADGLVSFQAVNLCKHNLQ